LTFVVDRRAFGLLREDRDKNVGLSGAGGWRKTGFVSPRESVAVLVAHPDDETLWAGGTLLMQTGWAPFVTTLCRASDADRAPKFQRVLRELSARGKMADLDDGPEQAPLADEQVEQALLEQLPTRQFERILTHCPTGEYTRHLRHEEVARGVLRLWLACKLSAPELWLFAYEDGGGEYLPRPVASADITVELPFEIWQRKLNLVTDSYGFASDSWEARVTPRREAFFRVKNRVEASAWLTPKYAP
jgi:LmbE family N-acetylglucosaminyl deacetylase